MLYQLLINENFAAYYLQQCYKDDPDVNECLRNSANRLAKFIRQGVPELGIEEVRITVLIISFSYVHKNVALKFYYFFSFFGIFLPYKQIYK